MPAIGMGMLWAGYTLTFWGYCLIRGYKIGVLDIVVPGHYGGDWPPPLVTDPGSKTPDPGAAPGTHPGDEPWSYPHGSGPEI